MNHPMLHIAVNAARQAAKIINRSLDRLDSLDVNEKSHNDFVTQVDQQAELAIIEIIHKSYPEHKILAEESGGTDGDQDNLWIIDPLDGTTNFIHGFPQFAISIAFQHQKKIEAALVYDPLRQELFTAARGRGAELNNRKMRVSNRGQLSHALLGTGFPFKELDHLPFYLKTFETFTKTSSGIRRAGAAALDLAYVAAGRLDGFWEMGLKAWDMAAGVLLITEAGGLVSDFTGSNKYFHSGNIIAGTSKVHKEMLDVIKNS